MNISPMFKKVAAPLILTSFILVTFFGFVSMSYGPDGRMQGDCPFSTMGTSLCPQSILPGVIHHLSAYQSFISVPVNSDITTPLSALLIVVSIALVFSFHPFLYKSLVPISYSSPPCTSHHRKVKRWLSLFEYSPPL